MNKQNNLRVYEPDTPQYWFYKEQHAKQTYEYVVGKIREYSSYEVMTIKKALAMMDNFIDPSDQTYHPKIPCMLIRPLSVSAKNIHMTKNYKCVVSYMI